ncbi:hypothetical protein CS0771_57370 [Catellatospora sp. IY07-71]|uniref:caspase family protein n=1 Tax=Catellatospora sp. IY07-71 TaxID=2728827 RepID=UPI001BB2EE46|nr:caspase family protein [Catellatospora sp. IY07-71]BCJ76193.1 hypothetical protein CS0771_57370 [Catellatospora sp. IY07-71]
MKELYLDERGSGPGVHALIIGVGQYPYLTGKYLEFDGYSDLTSAPVSALHFMKKLVNTDVAEWAVPVASVDLLLSPARTLVNAAGAEVSVADPTRENIQGAFDDWLERCASHPENIGVFYFCGHGVQAESQVLLASDFARFDGSPFMGAFAYDVSRDGILQFGPPTQCVFIDACRVPLTEQVRQLNRGVSALKTADAYGERRCAHDLTLRAPLFDVMEAPPNIAGYSDGVVSYFTSALTRALDGQAAVEEALTGEWVVDNQTVSSRMTGLLQQEIGTGTTGRAVEGAKIFDRKVLRRLHTPPSTKITVSCEPLAETGTLSCTPNPAVRAAYEHRAQDGEPWEFLAEAGHYMVTAECERGLHRVGPKPVYAAPPTSYVRLELTR